KGALLEENIDAIDREMEALKALPLPSDTRNALSGIAECILSGDFKKTGKMIAGLLDDQQNHFEFAERTS
ncbi:MAG: hypothetical protein LBD42_04725, partial [Desulfovibrio sp.]|nr:hypothetical protein [Desulfovibrio sp.]